MSKRPVTRALVATAVVAAVLPLGAQPAHAAPAASVVSAAAAEPVYSGFTTTAFSSPVRVELYEPSIPIPSTPQGELYAGYTKVKADSGQSTGRASFLWPGDAVGEGAKTFGDALGLPPELTEGGYPIQVNSQFPGDQQSEAQEPFPGVVMRTSSGDKVAKAANGFSADGSVGEADGPDAGTGGDGGDGGDGGNPLSGLTDQLQGLGGAAPSSSRASAAEPAAEEEQPGTPGLPPELAALVDVDGFASVSRMDATKSPVLGVSRTELGAVSLLSGIIRIGGVESSAKTTSDGVKATATGKSAYGTMMVGPQAFAIGPDGIVAQGATTPIPGLSDDPAKALEQLGVQIVVPKPTRDVEGDLGKSVTEGLRVVIDLAALSPVISQLPSAQLGALVPAEFGPLKGLVAGLSTMASKIVITLGVASSTVDTVPPIELPDFGLPGAPQAPPAAAPGGGSAGTGGAAGGVAGAPAAGGEVPGAAPGAGQTPVGALVDAAPAAAGLPELFTIPGMLLLGSIAAAVLAGAWMRRLGAAALGMGASCPHGLDSGLPDLRKA